MTVAAEDAELLSAIVSYSHGDPGWGQADVEQRKQQVLLLVAELCNSGIDADADAFQQNEDWTRWGPLKIAMSDYTLIVVSKAWKQAWEGTGDFSRYKGVRAEASAVRSIEQKGQDELQRRCRLILLPGSRDEDIPNGMHGLQRYRLDGFGKDLENLLRDLTGQPRFKRPSLGPRPDLPSVTPGCDRTKEAGHLAVRSRAERNALLEFSLASAAHLDQLPSYYPRHLSTLGLANKLKVSRLEPEWTRRYEDRHDLYSDARGGTGIPALEALDRDGTTILLGDPGHGKSTILAGMFLNWTRKLGRPALFSRLEDVGDFARKMPTLSTPLEAAEAIINGAAAAAHVAPSTRVHDALVHAIVENTDMLLLLDGLDEITTPGRRKAALQVLRLLGPLPSRLLIASRVTGYIAPVTSAAEFLVDRLTGQAVSSFVSDWFDDDSRREHEARARKVADSDVIAGIPIIAGFVCFVAEYDDVRATPFGVYEQYIDLFLERPWKPEAERLDGDAVAQRARKASELAWIMSTQSVQGHPDHRDFDDLAENPPRWTDTMSARELADDARSEGDLIEFVRDTGLLVPHSFNLPSSARRPFRWLHRTIHEHLTGRALGERLINDPARFEPWLLHAVLRPVWTVALAHTAGYMESRSELSSLIDPLLDGAMPSGWIEGPQLARVSEMLEAADSSYRRSELAARFDQRHNPSRAYAIDRKSSIARWRSADMRDRTGPELIGLQTQVLEEMRRPDSTVGERNELVAIIKRADDAGGARILTVDALAVADPDSGWPIFLDYLRLDHHAGSPVDLDHAPDAVIEAAAQLVAEDPTAIKAWWRIERMGPTEDGRIREALDRALQPHGAIGRLLLNLFDLNAPPFDRPLSISLSDAQELSAVDAPWWAAYVVGRRHDELRGELAGWARAGRSLRLFDDAASQMCRADLDRNQACAAVDALFAGDLRSPEPDDVSRFWQACRWFIDARDPARVAHMLRVFWMNETERYAQNPWVDGAFNMGFSTLRVMPWESLFQAMTSTLSNPGPRRLHFFSWLSKAIEASPMAERPQQFAQALGWALAHAPDDGAFSLQRSGNSPEVDARIALDALRLLEGTPPTATARAVLDWVISTCEDSDALPLYWSRIGRVWLRFHPDGGRKRRPEG